MVAEQRTQHNQNGSESNSEEREDVRHGDGSCSHDCGNEAEYTSIDAAGLKSVLENKGGLRNLRSVTTHLQTNPV